MIDEKNIDDCMTRIRAAVAAAPSHEELFAAFEALLRYEPTEAEAVTDGPGAELVPFEPAPEPPAYEPPLITE